MSESSRESLPGPVPAVTQKQIPEVLREENSEQSRLTDALRQREKVWQWIANVQQTVSRQRQPSLTWLTGVRNDLWAAYAKFNDLHNQVIALVPDDVIDEQANVYQSFEEVFMKVASSIEELKLDIQRPTPEDLIPEPLNENPSNSANPVTFPFLKWISCSSSAETEAVPVSAKKQLEFQVLNPQPPPVDNPRSKSLRDIRFSVPSTNYRKKENLLASRFPKRYATYERPSLFYIGVPSQRRDTWSDVHKRNLTQNPSEKETESSTSVPAKSTAASEDVATDTCLQSLAPAVIECQNPPASKQKQDQRDEENSSCVPRDSCVKVIPVPAEAYVVNVNRVNQDGSSIGENDQLLPPVVKTPDKIDQLHITPSDYQPRNSCVPLECCQPYTNLVIPRNLTTLFRITEAVIQSICQAIREHEIQPPVCVNIKTSRSCEPISHSESVASLLTSDKPIKPYIDRRCPPRRIATIYTPNVDVCITFKLCRTGVPNQFTYNDKQHPTISHIVQISLKASSYSDHSRGHISHEFREPMKKRAIEAPYAFSRKNHSNAPQLRIYWIDPDEPPNNYESKLPLAVDGTVARILTRPWDPGTNSPTSTIC